MEFILSWELHVFTVIIILFNYKVSVTELSEHLVHH